MTKRERNKSDALARVIDPANGEVVAYLHNQEVLQEFKHHGYWKVEQ